MTIRRALDWLLLCTAIAMAVFPTVDPDLWWHLKTGERIVTVGIPTVDPFSYTHAGTPWTAHEWLSDVILWSIYSAAGLPALSIAFAILAGLAFWIAYRSSPGRPYVAGIIMLLAIVASLPLLGVRCHVFNLFFMATFFWVVERVRVGGASQRALVALPMLSILWVNCHGGYLLGIALLLTCAVGEFLDGAFAATERAGSHRSLARALILTAGGCLVAALVNPAGYHMWTYAFDTLTSTTMRERIAEWASPNFHERAALPFAAMLLLGPLLWASSPVRPNWSDRLLFLGTAAASLSSRRHVGLFAIVATPILARSLMAILDATSARVLWAAEDGERISSPRAALNTRIVVVGMVALLVPSLLRLRDNDRFIAEAFPERAVDYLEREGFKERRGFNDYTWGGYLIWRGFTVYIDGRADVYGDFLDYAYKAFHVHSDWREPLDRHQVDWVLTSARGPLATVLETSKEWTERYSDDLARIFTRGGPRVEIADPQH